VCGVGLEIDVLDGLDSLVDRSLVRHNPASEGAVRFSMLETINEFAPSGSKRPAKPRTSAASRGVRRTLSEEAEPDLRREDHIRWLDRLEEENDNIRAALDWAVEAAAAELALRIARAMWRFWQLRGYVTEARARLERVLAMAGARGRTVHGRAPRGLGGIVYWQNDYAAMEQPYEEAVAIAEELGDRRLLSRAAVRLRVRPVRPAAGFRRGGAPASPALELAEDDDLC
jgi:hypothetical protein